MKKRMFIISAMIVCVLLTLVQAENRQVLTMEHQLGSVYESIFYDISVREDNSLLVTMRKADGTILTLGNDLVFGQDIHGLTGDNEDQVALAAGIVYTVNWNQLESGIRQGFKSGGGLLSTDPLLIFTSKITRSSNTLTYNDIQNPRWKLAEMLTRTGVLCFDENGVAMGCRSPIASGTRSGDVSSGSELLISSLTGSGTENNPYRWEGGTIGVAGDCEVLIWDEDGEWFAGFPGSNYQGSGTDSDPFKLFEALRGLSCDPATGKVSIRYLWDATKNSWGDTLPVEVPVRGATPFSEDGPVYTPSPPSSAIQSSCLYCQQIDEVWEKVRGALNIVQAGLTRPVWNPETNAWVEHTVLYAPSVQVQPRAQPRVTGTATLDLVKDIKPDAYNTEEQCFDRNYGSGGNIPKESVTVAGKTFAVNRAMAQPLRNVARVIENYGYQVKEIGSCRTKKDNAGNYKAANCGNFHLACLAVDINPSQNPHCPLVTNWADWWGYVPTAEERQRCSNREIITNIPPEIVKAFEENGFYWGGRYGQQYGQPTPDPMHFEFVDGTAKCCERKYSSLSYTYTGQPPAVAAVSAIPGVARKEQFDQHIHQAAQKFGVDAALIKALIRQESTFDPNAPRGGLMQVNDFGDHYNNMVSTYSDLASLSNNVADPRTNIFVGTYVFDLTRESLHGCIDWGCQIAAYNVGQSVINAAAKDASAPPTWDKVQSVLSIAHFKKFDPYRSWTDEDVQNRVNLVKNYVRDVLQYRGQYEDRV